MKHEANSQVVQRVQAGERLLGHRADLVALQEAGKQQDSVSASNSYDSEILHCHIESDIFLHHSSSICNIKQDDKYYTIQGNRHLT